MKKLLIIAGLLLAGITAHSAELVKGPRRPSQASDRTFVIASTASQTTDQTFYTVTASKTLYMEQVCFSGVNTSTATAGQFQLRDNATAKTPFLVEPGGVLGALTVSAFRPSCFVLPDPIPFATSVVADVVAGTLTYSIWFTGYEE